MGIRPGFCWDSQGDSQGCFAYPPQKEERKDIWNCCQTFFGGNNSEFILRNCEVSNLKHQPTIDSEVKVHWEMAGWKCPKTLLSECLDNSISFFSRQLDLDLENLSFFANSYWYLVVFLAQVVPASHDFPPASHTARAVASGKLAHIDWSKPRPKRWLKSCDSWSW